MQPCYLVTGAAGHLGSTIVSLLRQAGREVRALVWPQVPVPGFEDVACYVGDIRDPETLKPLFEGLQNREIYVIHAAGLIALEPGQGELLRQVNLEGTRNLLALAVQYRVRRFLYVSSVHALAPGAPGQVIREADSFSPELVEGDYAKSKALAAQAVLDAAAQGLPAVVVLPSGILGPGNWGASRLVRLLGEYLRGKLRFTVRGGYDFVDVRDVAEGCIRALHYGTPGSCYLLTGMAYEIRELLAMVRPLRHRPRPLTLPLWAARLGTPLLNRRDRSRGLAPLCTPYALDTLRTPHRFSHDRAAFELGYSPRDLRYTVRDTVVQLLEQA